MAIALNMQKHLGANCEFFCGFQRQNENVRQSHTGRFVVLYTTEEHLVLTD
jgi:hypothetical protein